MEGHEIRHVCGGRTACSPSKPALDEFPSPLANKISKPRRKSTTTNNL